MWLVFAFRLLGRPFFAALTKRFSGFRGSYYRILDWGLLRKPSCDLTRIHAWVGRTFFFPLSRIASRASRHERVITSSPYDAQVENIADAS